MFRTLYDRIDHSPRLAGYLKNVSSGLSHQRGLPTLIAIGLALLSLIVHLVLDFATAAVFMNILGDVLLHAAILIGLLGVLLAEPIGRG